MNKRGQEIAWGTIIIGLVIIVVAVLIILFASGYFDKFGRAGEAIPQGLAAAAQGCNLAVRGNSVTSFCYELKEVSDNEFVNCEDSRIKDELDKSGAQSFSCNRTLVDSVGAAQCKKISNPNDWDNVKVNGKICNSYDCELLDGESLLPPETECKSGRKITLSGGRICCIQS